MTPPQGQGRKTERGLGCGTARPWGPSWWQTKVLYAADLLGSQPCVVRAVMRLILQPSKLVVEDYVAVDSLIQCAVYLPITKNIFICNYMCIGHAHTV